MELIWNIKETLIIFKKYWNEVRSGWNLEEELDFDDKIQMWIAVAE